MIVPLLLLMAQAAISTSPSQDDVIVTGRRAEKALEACLARNCPPAEDVEASLLSSVEQFADGRYRDAQRTLQSAIRRNRDHAAELPGPVSSLYATLAKVAEHEGDTDLWRSSARNDVLVLRRHLGESNIATLREELVFADSMVGLGALDSAATNYHMVQQKAAKRGEVKLAAHAAFRRAWLALMLGREKDAERFADEAVEIAGPGNRRMLELRDILHLRIAIRPSNEGAVDALAARLRQSTAEAPVILFQRPVEDINPSQTFIVRNPQLDSAIRFSDVGYWVRSDGRTAEVEVLRNSGLGPWASVILRQVRERRYVPLDVEPGHAGIYRIDRFTVRAAMGTPIGTRIKRRMGPLTVHVVDITATDAMSAAHHERTQETGANGGG
ncbi:hypothetical protein [Sphingomonas endolithica]|uniref:hypothetical protein n=1 Tax=Sphingomonas endolithica TaxID=2972485 RepID=UPI0021AF1D6D|nr:hypothetical protein [Sphingomonas sp. ZFBP2030]